MKNKKSMIYKILIVICIIFVFIALTNQSHALLASIAGTALKTAGFVWLAQLFIAALGFIITGILDGDPVSAILFNERGTTTASFFDGIGIKSNYDKSDVVTSIIENVTKFYGIMFYLALALLLFILLYIGIRMAISTVAEKEAKYKKMLTNWGVSLVLLIFLHLIMVATFYINNTLVSSLSRLKESQPVNWGELYGDMLKPIVGLDEAILFLMVLWNEFLFFIIYVKRIITLAFLMIIAPLICVTYSIDKIGDNKSQALNTWLREFIVTVIIQPFHCILYIVLIVPAVNGAGVNGNGITSGVLYIIMLTFVRNAETIIKKIFGIRADSMPDSGSTAAVTFGVVQGLMKNLGKGKKSGTSGKTMPDLRDEDNRNADNSLRDEQGQDDNNNPPAPDPNNPPVPNPNNPPVPNPNNPPVPVPDPNNPPVPDPNNPPVPDPNDSPVPDANGDNATRDSKRSKIGDVWDEFKYSLGWRNNRETGENIKGILKDSAKGGLGALGAMAGAAGGLSLGKDPSSAITMGMAGYAGANAITNAIENVDEEFKLSTQEDYFAGAVEDFGRGLQNATGEQMSRGQIRDHALELWKNYNDGLVTLEHGLDGQELSSYERDFLEKASKMDDVYSYIGADDSSAAVSNAIRQVMAGNKKPTKKYPYKNARPIQRPTYGDNNNPPPNNN